MPDPPNERKRTPLPKLLAGVFRMFSRPAMFGWTLKAFSSIVMLLVPFAVVSSYASTPPESRWKPLGAGAVMFAIAFGLRRVGKRLRGE